MIDDREITVSSGFENATWPGASNRVGWGAILGDAVGGPDVSPYAAAARATDLEGLPATYMEVGGSEVFRDEDIDYATRLGHAGVPTELHVWVGGFHGFEIWAPDSEIGRATLDARTSYLRRALRNGGDCLRVAGAPGSVARRQDFAPGTIPHTAASAARTPPHGVDPSRGRTCRPSCRFTSD